MERPSGCIAPQQQLTHVQLEVDDIYEHIYIEGRSGVKIRTPNQAMNLTGSLWRPNVVLLFVVVENYIYMCVCVCVCACVCVCVRG